MDERFQEIIDFVNDVKIKKVIFGGYDKNDVTVKMNELMVKFENYTKEQQEKQKAQLEECEVKIQTSKILINELNKKLSSLMLEQKNIEREKEKMQGAYKAYCSGILKQYSESLCSLSTEFSQILDNITVLQKNMAETDIFDKIEVHVEEQAAIPCVDEDMDEVVFEQE